MKNIFGNLQDSLRRLEDWMRDPGSVVFTSRFERILDTLLRFKKVDPAAIDGKNMRQRIHRKLGQTLKAYRTEIGSAASWAFLPAKYSKYLLMVVLAMDLFAATESPRKA